MSDEGMLIRGADMVLPDGRVVAGDVRVTAGSIETVAVGGGLEPRSGETVIDAEGLHLLPGAIDPQVHFREPGQPHKETLASGARAAVAGGVTSFLDMPNNVPAATSLEAMRTKLDAAARTSVAHHGFFIGATPDNLASLQEAVGTPDSPTSRPGICGIKIFMGSSTGDLLVDKEEAQRRIFEGTAGIIAVHAEDQARLQARAAAFSGRTDVLAHAEWRDAEVALLATQQAVGLAEEAKHRLHVLHLTSGLEADWLAGRTGDLVTTEVCPQHLTFSDEDVAREGTRLQMNPPIRYAEDRDTLWRRLHDGTICCIATDHAPHTLGEKGLGYPNSPAGMPGVETSLPVMLTHALDGRCSLSDVVRWMCAAPADCYAIEGKGRVQEGGDADLVLVDLDRRRVVEDSDVWTTVGWTPFRGRELTGWPVLTIVGGVPVHRRRADGPLRGEPLVGGHETGEALRFG
jgi:dihydroorotase